MKWLNVITNKPWEPGQEATNTFVHDNSSDAAKETAFRFLLAVITVVFFLFTITFLQRSQSYDFQALAGEIWLPFNDLTALWRSSFLLLGASISLALGLRQARNLNAPFTLVTLLSAILFSLAFLFSQIDIWQQLNSQGYGLTSNPANSYFYLLTAVHGIHMLVGLYVLLNVSFRLLLDKFQTDTYTSLRLTANYWHFMLGIWCFLFVLLTRDTQTYKTIAAICGF